MNNDQLIIIENIPYIKKFDGRDASQCGKNCCFFINANCYLKKFNQAYHPEICCTTKDLLGFYHYIKYNKTISIF